ITRWIVDTRTLWPGERIQDCASEYLPLISDEERKNVLRKYHIADARMALASALLKRAYVAKWTGLPWADIRFSRRGHPVHGKPCWNPPQYTRPGQPWPKLDFNVSHQAGLATLAGICVPEAYNSNESPEDQILIGCDIVAPHERCDLASILTSDFEDYTATFCNIFSDEELFDITYNLPTNAVTLLNGERLSADTLGRLDRTINADLPLSVTMPDGRIEAFSSDLIIDAKLRQFYTYFCLKEAYIKMVGEGLLAPWIRDCEFRNVHAPTPGTAARCSTAGTWGGKTSGGRSNVVENYVNGSHEGAEELEVCLNGEELTDVRTEVQAFEEEYMISTMVK
ncbi:4'-phosphopantetheinyl transferase, partial [Tothia fuscella]